MINSEVIGFIGLGNMGMPMVKNLLGNGYSVRVFDLEKKAIEKASAHGAIKTLSISEVSENTEYLITMLPNTPEVESVITGKDGLINFAPERTIIIDMSSISPVATKKIAKVLEEKGIDFLDAPVSGGVKGAEEGTLSIMVGGKENIFNKAKKILSSMGKFFLNFWGLGYGQSNKLFKNIICAINIQAICEALALGRSLGIDLSKMRDVLLGGAASSWMLENLAPKMINGDSSAGFRIELQLKDLRLAQEAAFELGIPLPSCSLATNMYLEARAHGEDNNGNQAMFKTYNRLSNQ